MTSILKVSTIQDPTNSNTALTVGSNGGVTMNTTAIKDASGTNTALTINSSGQILMPAKPAFRVRHVNGSTGAVTGVIQFNTVDHNAGSHWDTNNYYFVVPVTGFYSFQFNGLGSDSSGQKVAANVATVVEMQKSTSSSFSSYTIFGTCYDATTSSTTYRDMSFSISELLNANEYVRLNVTNGSYIYTDASANQKYDPVFSGFLVG